MMRIFYIGFFSFICLGFSLNNFSDHTEEIILDYLEMKYPNEQFDSFIYIGIKRNKLYYFNTRKIESEFQISTAKNGAGCEKGSQKTPIGLHEIRHKVGENTPIGGIFDHKEFKGDVKPINTTNEALKKDYITTRIISLRGLEQGLNKGEGIDSYERAIYIHGTLDEGLIGQSVSHGCIRMKNNEIIELFDIIEEGTKVILLNN